MIREEFTQGFVCACSSIYSAHHEDTIVIEALESCGVTTLKDMQENNVDEYDIEILSPLFKELKRRKKMSRRGRALLKPNKSFKPDRPSLPTCESVKECVVHPYLCKYLINDKCSRSPAA